MDDPCYCQSNQDNNIFIWLKDKENNKVPRPLLSLTPTLKVIKFSVSNIWPLSLLSAINCLSETKDKFLFSSGNILWKEGDDVMHIIAFFKLQFICIWPKFIITFKFVFFSIMQQLLIRLSRWTAPPRICPPLKLLPLQVIPCHLQLYQTSKYLYLKVILELSIILPANVILWIR